MLWQIEWRVQNRPITKNSFASNYFTFLIFFFNMKTSDKDLTWCTNYPDVYIHTFVSTGVLFEGAFSSCVSLTFSWRRSLSYRHQSIDLLCKSMGWFLYGRDLRHERGRWRKSRLVMISQFLNFRILVRFLRFCMLQTSVLLNEKYSIKAKKLKFMDIEFTSSELQNSFQINFAISPINNTKLLK